MSKKVAIALVILTVLLLSIVAWSGAAGAPNTRATLAGSAPAWANAKNYTGTADTSTVIGFRVYLGWRNAAGAEALAKAVSDPSSSSYGKYLTPAQFRKQFAPTQAQVGTVQTWLRAQGFAVTYTPANNHYVEAEGTVAQAAAAFSTTFGMYKVNGRSVRAPKADVTIPSALSGVVTSVVGLDQSAVFITTDHIVDSNAPPSPGFRNAHPLSDYYGELLSGYSFPTGFDADTADATVPWAVKGYTPTQIKSAYGIASSYDGAGETVAIIDAYASPTILQDVNQWSVNRGLPTMTAGQLTQVVAPGTYKRAENKAQDPQGWWGEETLDVGRPWHGSGGQDRVRRLPE